MEHAKKMLLIDPSVIEKIQQHNAVDSPMSRLDTEMQNILKSEMDDRKKCILYLQILQRYLHFTEGERQPIQLPLVSRMEVSDSDVDNSGYDTVDNKNSEINVKDSVTVYPSIEDEQQENYKKSIYSPNNILSLIPKTYIKKGERLLYLLSTNHHKIRWDNDGTITVDNKEIPGSNIVDLVNDCLRPLKRSDPIGWEKFAKALKDIKIPQIYIGNKKRLDYIKLLQEKEPTDKGEEFFSTPLSSRTKRNIDWEKWNPY